MRGGEFDDLPAVAHEVLVRTDDQRRGALTREEYERFYDALVHAESAPRAVSASGGIFHLQGRITTPDTLTAQFEFEAFKALPCWCVATLTSRRPGR